MFLYLLVKLKLIVGTSEIMWVGFLQKQHGPWAVLSQHTAGGPRTRPLIRLSTGLISFLTTTQVDEIGNISMPPPFPMDCLPDSVFHFSSFTTLISLSVTSAKYPTQCSHLLLHPQFPQYQKDEIPIVIHNSFLS